MATIKQRKAVERIIEKRGNVSRSMEEVGYRKATAHNPKNLTESKGFRELMNEYGLTDQLLLESLVYNIKKNRGKNTKDIELGSKIKGWLRDGINIGGDLKVEIVEYGSDTSRNEEKADNS